MFVVFNRHDDKDSVKCPAKKTKKAKAPKNTLFVIGSVGANILFEARSVRYVPFSCKKPVIYLYREASARVCAKLYFDGLTLSYTEYDEEWNVTAYPCGILVDEDVEEYNHLFREACFDTEYDFK